MELDRGRLLAAGEGGQHRGAAVDQHRSGVQYLFGYHARELSTATLLLVPDQSQLSVDPGLRHLLQQQHDLRPPDRGIRRGKLRVHRLDEADGRRARRDALVHPEPLPMGTRTRTGRAPRPVRSETPNHAEGEVSVPGRPEQTCTTSPTPRASASAAATHRSRPTATPDLDRRRISEWRAAHLRAPTRPRTTRSAPRTTSATGSRSRAASITSSGIKSSRTSRLRASAACSSPKIWAPRRLGASTYRPRPRSDPWTSISRPATPSARYTTTTRPDVSRAQPRLSLCRQQRRCDLGSGGHQLCTGHQRAVYRWRSAPQYNFQLARARSLHARGLGVPGPQPLAGSRAGSDNNAPVQLRLLVHAARDELHLGARRHEIRRPGSSQRSATTCSIPIPS